MILNESSSETIGIPFSMKRTVSRVYVDTVSNSDVL